MRGRKLSADSRLAHRHHRKREADDVDAQFQQSVGHATGQPGIANHDRHDRVLPRYEAEARRLHPLTEVAGIVSQLAAQLVAGLNQIEHRQGCRRDHRRDGIRE